MMFVGVRGAVELSNNAEGHWFDFIFHFGNLSMYIILILLLKHWKTNGNREGQKQVPFIEIGIDDLPTLNQGFRMPAI